MSFATGSLQRLVDVVESFPRVRVCCVGDVMLDHFVYGSVSRISPEAPVPILRIERRESMLGGAGNAVRNLTALSCPVQFFSVTGDDAVAAEVGAALAGLPNCTWHLETEAGRLTTIKTRYVSDGQQIMRADVESDTPVASRTTDSLLARFEQAVGSCDVVLLSDYAKGVLSGDNVQSFLRIAGQAGKPVIVDPKGRDFRRYRGATLIKPNLKELHEATGLPVDTEAAREEAAHRLLAHLDAQYLLVTCGAAGMLLVARDGTVQRFPSVAREVFDVSGAGDTAAAALAAGIGARTSIGQAVEVANLAAGIVVGKHGTAVVTPGEIVHEIRHRSVSGAGDKILEIAELLETAARWRRSGYRIGFTSGWFDLLHPGHLALLEKARAHCDRLVVGIHGDQSAARLERTGPPVQDEVSRSLVLASLRCVDAVVILRDESPLDLLGRLRPELLVHGRQDGTGDVPGANLLPNWQGELLLVDLVPGYDSAGIAARLADVAKV